MNHRIIQTLLGAALLILCLEGLQLWSVETDFEAAASQKIAIKSGERLKMDFVVGGITVVTSEDVEEIEYSSQFKLIGKAARKDLAAEDIFEWKFSSDKEGPVLEMDWKDKKWKVWKWRKGWNVVVKHTLKVPSTISIEAKTAEGAIEVTDLQGELKAHTSGGNVIVGKINGLVNIQTSGGSIQASDINGTAKLQTSGGSIKAGNVNGPLNARTSGGSITVDSVVGKLEARTSGGSIRAKLNQPSGEPVVLETSGGSISLSVPEDFAANLSAKTSGGRVTCQIPFDGRSQRSSMEGTINGGGPEVRLRTSGGSIAVVKE